MANQLKSHHGGREQSRFISNDLFEMSENESIIIRFSKKKNFKKLMFLKVENQTSTSMESCLAEITMVLPWHFWRYIIYMTLNNESMDIKFSNKLKFF